MQRMKKTENSFLGDWFLLAKRLAVIKINS